MKKSALVILVVVILIFGLGTLYMTQINVFSESTVKSLTLWNRSETDIPGYTLSEADKDALFEALSSREEEAVPIPEAGTSYVLTLVNKWDLTEAHTLYYVPDSEPSKNMLRDVYVGDENQAHVYRLTHPGFFFTFPGFDALYADDRFSPVSIRVAEIPVTPTPDTVLWQYRLGDGVTWRDDDVAVLKTPDAETVPLSITDPDTPLVVFCDKPFSKILYSATDHATGDVALKGSIESKDVSLEALSEALMPLPEDDGTFTYTLEVFWASDTRPYRGTATLNFQVTLDRPVVFKLSNTSGQLGELLTIHALYTEPGMVPKLSTPLTDAVRWYPEKGHMVTYIPLAFRGEPGVYPIEISTDASDIPTTFEVTLGARDFKVQQLYVDKETVASTRNDAALEEYRTVYMPIRKTSADVRYESGPFALPCKGRITTEFGEYRTVNGNLTSYRHNGLDIAAPKGTPVHAAGAGQVVCSRAFIMMGNTVIIDHGQGLFSVYLHLDTLGVEKDAFVEKSQAIGSVGSTGFSTGAHLHFTMSYFTTDLEPGFFIFGEAVTKENYKHLMDALPN